MLCCLVVIPSIFLAVDLPHSVCPSSTFQSGTLPTVGLGVIQAIMLGLVSLLVLFVSTGAKFNIWSYADHPSAPSSGKSSTVYIALSTAGHLTAGAMYTNSVNFYFCVTPSNILIRSGYFDAPRALGWDDIATVRAMCWISNPGSGSAKPYHGATLRLSFRDKEQIPIGLVNGDHILMNVYRSVRQSLQNKTYDYNIDPSVAPSLCPPVLYPLLSVWRSE